MSEKGGVLFKHTQIVGSISAALSWLGEERGKRLLVRVVEKFEKMVVREIGTPKAVVILIPRDHDQQLGKIRNL